MVFVFTCQKCVCVTKTDFLPCKSRKASFPFKEKMWVLKLTVLALVIGAVVCPPVNDKKKKTENEEGKKDEEDMEFGLQYERYLKEIVGVLETDETFRKRLEEAQIEDIKTGDIAQHLEMVNHNVRTKLDEIKRREVERLNQIKKLLDHRKANENGTAGPGSPLSRRFPIPVQAIDAILSAQGLDKDMDHDKIAAHVDHSNPDTFEVEDLKKLIQKATNDLEDLDKERKKEFKDYEMEKEMLRKQKLKQMDERKRAEEEQRYKEQQEKHKKHPDLNHPGGRKQLEEVWEDEDGLDKEAFNPKTFFKMHDTNGDGVLDMHEVEALFQHELDKIYDPDAPEDDMMERYEEMNRMREHVMNEVDKNKDHLISLEEFLDSAKEENQDDEGWQGLDEQEIYTDEEFEKYEQEYLRQRESLQKQKEEQLRFEGHQQGQQGQVPQMNQGQAQMNQGQGQVPPAVHAQNQQQNQQQFQQQQQQQQQQMGNQVPVHPAAKHKPQQEQQQWQQHGDNSLRFQADSSQGVNDVNQNLHQAQQGHGQSSTAQPHAQQQVHQQQATPKVQHQQAQAQAQQQYQAQQKAQQYNQQAHAQQQHRQATQQAQQQVNAQQKAQAQAQQQAQAQAQQQAQAQAQAQQQAQAQAQAQQQQAQAQAQQQAQAHQQPQYQQAQPQGQYNQQQYQQAQPQAQQHHAQAQAQKQQQQQPKYQQAQPQAAQAQQIQH